MLTNMGPVFWDFKGLVIPMVEVDKILHTTTSCLAGALGTTEIKLRMIYNRHKKEFDALRPLSITFDYAKDLREFFQKHGQTFQSSSPMQTGRRKRAP